MIVNIAADAENDIADGYWFHEDQETGLGGYFRSSVYADIEALAIYGGCHPVVNGFHRSLCKTFPYFVYYVMDTPQSLTVIGQRRDPEWARERLA